MTPDAICAQRLSQSSTSHYTANSRAGSGRSGTPMERHCAPRPYASSRGSSRSMAYLFCRGMLNIWKMRNERIFNNKSASRRQLQWLIAQDIALWSSRTPKLKDELMLWACGQGRFKTRIGFLFLFFLLTAL
jgi:hypothetical protein